jgi:hypothetical protein
MRTNTYRSLPPSLEQSQTPTSKNKSLEVRCGTPIGDRLKDVCERLIVMLSISLYAALGLLTLVLLYVACIRIASLPPQW